jgi:YesN/AraC family two-component response regulator
VDYGPCCPDVEVEKRLAFMPSHLPYTVPYSVPYSVVVVEDTHDLRSLWTLMLERDTRFAVVAEAANGRSGVAAVEEHRPDLVLLDIAMPIMDGLQALSLIRDRSPRSRVVMLSSFSRDSRQAAQAMALGAHGFLRKGLPRADLLRKLETILRGNERALGAARLG